MAAACGAPPRSRAVSDDVVRIVFVLNDSVGSYADWARSRFGDRGKNGRRGWIAAGHRARQARANRAPIIRNKSDVAQPLPGNGFEVGKVDMHSASTIRHGAGG